MIVLDTNVISELMKNSPARQVMSALATYPTASIYTTTITQAEILYGILLLPAGKRRSAFKAAAEAMFDEEFFGRILPFGSDAVQPYATIASTRSLKGRPISHFDAQIAAIAYAAGAILFTRNIKDFEQCGVKLVNPWT